MRPLIDRFMPGERLGDALGLVGRLQQERLPVVLSYLGENVTSDTAADAAAAEYTALLTELAAGRFDAQISIKLTQLGWDVGMQRATERLRRLLEQAAVLGIGVNIDMEASTYTDAALDAYMGVYDRHPDVGLCVQAYLRRTPADLDRLLALRARVRLVKGAYRETADVALQDKSAISTAYFEMARRLLAAVTDGVVPSFGTHDLGLIERIRAVALEMGVPPSAYDIQMLYGINGEALRRLAASGVRTRIFICYGTAWYPWFMRRLAERPANLVTALRNLV